MDLRQNRMGDQHDDLEWRDGVPISTRFEDPYYSLDNGLAETRHVFLDANDLPARYCDGFHIAELGFGTGLNFLAAWLAWGDLPGTLTFTSFEAYPLSTEATEAALVHFPEVADLAAQLIAALSGPAPYCFGNITLNLILGDARTTLPAWDGQADVWFLDGFSPARNPELWGPDLMAAVARHTVRGGTASTYSAAGFVRAGLTDGGFDVSRIPGFGRKRHMTRAVLP